MRNKRHNLNSTKTVTFEQVSGALDHIASIDGDDKRSRNARALGHAEVLLWSALFGSANDWQQVRDLLLNNMEVKT